jgi:hypothetical protein
MPNFGIRTLGSSICLIFRLGSKAIQTRYRSACLFLAMNAGRDKVGALSALPREPEMPFMFPECDLFCYQRGRFWESSGEYRINRGIPK